VLRAPVSIDQSSPLTLVASADGVTLSGLEIRGGFSAGLLIDGPDDVSVLNCKIHGAGVVALDIRNSANILIDGCTVKSSGQMNAPDGHGISLTNSPSTRLHANTIQSTRAFAIVIDNGSHSSVVSRNTILNCGGGISVGPPRQPLSQTSRPTPSAAPPPLPTPSASALLVASLRTTLC
jgi:hypothetical protein